MTDIIAGQILTTELHYRTKLTTAVAHADFNSGPLLSLGVAVVEVHLRVDGEQ